MLSLSEKELCGKLSPVISEIVKVSGQPESLKEFIAKKSRETGLEMNSPGLLLLSYKHPSRIYEVVKVYAKKLKLLEGRAGKEVRFYDSLKEGKSKNACLMEYLGILKSRIDMFPKHNILEITGKDKTPRPRGIISSKAKHKGELVKIERNAIKQFLETELEVLKFIREKSSGEIKSNIEGKYFNEMVVELCKIIKAIYPVKAGVKNENGDEKELYDRAYMPGEVEEVIEDIQKTVNKKLKLRISTRCAIMARKIINSFLPGEIRDYRGIIREWNRYHGI